MFETLAVFQAPMFALNAAAFLNVCEPTTSSLKEPNCGG
jgi:hypothetical protein